MALRSKSPGKGPGNRSALPRLDLLPRSPISLNDAQLGGASPKTVMQPFVSTSKFERKQVSIGSLLTKQSRVKEIETARESRARGERSLPKVAKNEGRHTARHARAEAEFLQRTQSMSQMTAVFEPQAPSARTHTVPQHRKKVGQVSPGPGGTTQEPDGGTGVEEEKPAPQVESYRKVLFKAKSVASLKSPEKKEQKRKCSIFHAAPEGLMLDGKPGEQMAVSPPPGERPPIGARGNLNRRHNTRGSTFKFKPTVAEKIIDFDAEGEVEFRSPLSGVEFTVSTFPQLLMKMMRAAPKTTTALIDGVTDEKINYHDLAGSVENVAHSLAALGVEKGDVFAFASSNSIAYVVMFIAAQMCGALVALVHQQIADKDLLDELKDVAPKYIFTSNALLERLEKLTVNLSSVKVTAFVVLDGTARSGGFGPDVIPYLPLTMRSGKQPFCFIDPHEDPFLLSYTRDGTGKLRAVKLPHWAGVTALQQLEAVFDSDVEHTRVFTNYLSFTNVFALVGGVGYSVASCSTMIIFDPSADPRDLSASLRRYNATYLITSGAYLKQLGEGTREELTGLRCVLTAGPPRQTGSNDWFSFRADGCRMVQVMTSAEAVVSHMSYATESNEIGCVGQALPNVRFKIVDSVSMASLESGRTGELLMKGPQFTNGYYNATRDDSLFDADGYYKTGDTAMVNAKGNLVIVASSKEEVSPCFLDQVPPLNAEELEDIIRKHENVVDSIVLQAYDTCGRVVTEAYVKLCEVLEDDHGGFITRESDCIAPILDNIQLESEIEFPPGIKVTEWFLLPEIPSGVAQRDAWKRKVLKTSENNICSMVACS